MTTVMDLSNALAGAVERVSAWTFAVHGRPRLPSTGVQWRTGLVVTAWEGPLYQVRAIAPDLGWTMRAEIYRALEFEGELRVDDPDGIVVEAAFLPSARCIELLVAGAQWVHEPLTEWLSERWGPDDPRAYHYDVQGTSRDSIQVRRGTG